MALNLLETQQLENCIKNRLLSPIPDIIEWPSELKVRIRRPIPALFSNAEFYAWRKRHQDVLPDWVLGVSEAWQFTNVIGILSHLVENLESSNTLAHFTSQYRQKVDS